MKSVSDLLTELKMPTGASSTVIEGYIKDAIRELQASAHENVKETLMTITSGIELYNYPSDMVKLISIAIDKDVTNYNRYYLETIGRRFKIRYLNDSTDILETPTSTIANAVRITYTAYEFPFVLAPDGSAQVSDFVTTPATIYTTNSGTQTIIHNDVVYISDNYRADYGIRFHYYQALSGLGSIDLGSEDYTDTTNWSDATVPKTSVSNDNKYIGVSDNFYQALLEYVKSRVARETDDFKLENYRMLKFNQAKNKAIENRDNNSDIVISDDRYSIV